MRIGKASTMTPMEDALLQEAQRRFGEQVWVVRGLRTAVAALAQRQAAGDAGAGAELSTRLAELHRAEARQARWAEIVHQARIPRLWQQKEALRAGEEWDARQLAVVQQVYRAVPSALVEGQLRDLMQHLTGVQTMIDHVQHLLDAPDQGRGPSWDDAP
jgi:hypothetical protein